MGDRIVLWLLMPRRACYALTSDGFLGFRGPRAAGKHRDGSLASWSHASLNAVRFYWDSQRHVAAGLFAPSSSHTVSRGDDVSHRKPGSHNLRRHLLLTPGCAVMPPFRGTTAARDQSVVVGCINKLPSLRRETAARFDSACLSCSSSAHLPDGCAASCHRADRSRRTQLSGSRTL